MKIGFVKKIGATTFVVNTMPAEDAKHTQEKAVKALIAREAMALKTDDLSATTWRKGKTKGKYIRSEHKESEKFWKYGIFRELDR